MSESEKYEVLEKIGQFAVAVDADNLLLTIPPGHGSFGVIHKVRRKSDGLVSGIPFERNQFDYI